MRRHGVRAGDVGNSTVTLSGGVATVQVTASVAASAASGEYEGYVRFANTANASDS